MGKVWEATETWERLENRLGKVREGKVLHGKTLGRVWEEVLFIVMARTSQKPHLSVPNGTFINHIKFPIAMYMFICATIYIHL